MYLCILSILHAVVAVAATPAWDGQSRGDVG